MVNQVAAALQPDLLLSSNKKISWADVDDDLPAHDGEAEEDLTPNEDSPNKSFALRLTKWKRKLKGGTKTAALSRPPHIDQALQSLDSAQDIDITTFVKRKTRQPRAGEENRPPAPSKTFLPPLENPSFTAPPQQITLPSSVQDELDEEELDLLVHTLTALSKSLEGGIDDGNRQQTTPPTKSCETPGPRISEPTKGAFDDTSHAFTHVTSLMCSPMAATHLSVPQSTDALANNQTINDARGVKGTNLINGTNTVNCFVPRASFDAPANGPTVLKNNVYDSPTLQGYAEINELNDQHTRVLNYGGYYGGWVNPAEDYIVINGLSLRVWRAYLTSLAVADTQALADSLSRGLARTLIESEPFAAPTTMPIGRRITGYGSMTSQVAASPTAGVASSPPVVSPAGGPRSNGQLVWSASAVERPPPSDGRFKQIARCKATPEYLLYIEKVPREKRLATDPQTPRIAGTSWREFSSDVRAWKVQLHRKAETLRK